MREEMPSVQKEQRQSKDLRDLHVALPRFMKPKLTELTSERDAFLLAKGLAE